MDYVFRLEGINGSQWGSGTMHACSVTKVIVLVGRDALLGVACHRMQA